MRDEVCEVAGVSPSLLAPEGAPVLPLHLTAPSGGEDDLGRRHPTPSRRRPGKHGATARRQAYRAPRPANSGRGALQLLRRLSLLAAARSHLAAHVNAKQKGTRVRHAERSTDVAGTSKAGLFATLAVLLRSVGSGASKARCARVLALTSLVSVLGVLGFCASAADANTGYRYSFSFSSPEGFNGPLGLAVDDSADASAGDVYVVDQGNEALKKFSVSGESATQEWKAELPGSTPYQGTVNDYAGVDEGDVYVAGFGNGVVYQVTPAGVVSEVLTGVANPTDVAVDAAGDFFVVSNAEGKVLEYNGSWEPVDAAGIVVFADENTVVEGLNGPQALTVSSNGEDIYAATAVGAVQYTLTGMQYLDTATLGGASGEVATWGVTVAPSGGVFVDRGNEVVFYEPSGALAGKFGAGVLTEGFGVGVTTGDAYVADHGAGEVRVFEAGITPETPETLPASAVTATSAVLNGDLKLGAGETQVSYFFEYSKGASCSGAGSARTPAMEGSGVVAEEVSGLVLGTQYTFCLVAENSVGETIGGEQSFTTVAVGDENSPSVTASEAEVSAKIGTGEETTSYQVQYGTSSVEESSTPEVSVAASSEPVEVEQRLGGLKASTTYHFRFLISNGHGHTTGEERSFTTPAAPETTAETCPNAQRRTEQPFGLTLPDCRAYEMVSPANTGGQDATEAGLSPESRAAESGEAFTFASYGGFSSVSGETIESQYLARREPGGWSTQGITPLQEARRSTVTAGDFEAMTFTPELTEAVANTTALLTPEAHGTEKFELYLEDFSGTPPYRYVGPGRNAVGASADLSHVLYEEDGILGGETDYAKIAERVNGAVIPVGVANDGETISANVGDQAYEAGTLGGGSNEKDDWRAVSENGLRVYFTSGPYISTTSGHITEEGNGTLYLRVNAEQPQSALANPEANATGTLTAGSTSVTEVTSIPGAHRHANLAAGSTEVTLLPGGEGTVFYAGQPISGEGIPAGTTIVAVSAETSGSGVDESLTLSAPAEASGTEVFVTSTRPDTFTVGQKISGYGLAAGTTVTAVGSETLTLSAPADVSASEVALTGGGECTETSKACTLDVSASQRAVPDDHGLRTARYWGASSDGSKVFFTSKAELTEDAYTGSEDNAANLYEYDLEDEKLTDLTVDRADAAEGAAVQGVVQVSADGSYVYYVATGALPGAGENAQHESAEAGADNLYVSHDDGAPRFIATLEGLDSTDWKVHTEKTETSVNGPENDSVVANPSGTRLAFVSERSLTGYDNEQAQPGDCEGAAYNGNGEETGRCREVYLYDAETGGLECASCNASGARPVGPASLNLYFPHYVATYRARNLLEDGTLFFESSDAIVPGASDGRKNVYEDEGGHVYAISNVAGRYESFFLDASANGDNVFFGSADQLLPEDKSDNVVVWDARVGGGFPVAASASTCENGDSCKPPASAQPATLTAPPPSATFSGPGDFTPTAPVKVEPLTRKQKLARALKLCKKKSKRKRADCEQAARKRFGVKKEKATKKHTKTAAKGRRGR